MTWDWWYYYKTITVGIPMVTLGLAVLFALHLHFAIALGLLVATSGELCLWFYRWIEWRHPAAEQYGSLHSPASSGSTVAVFRRQGAAG